MAKEAKAKMLPTYKEATKQHEQEQGEGVNSDAVAITHPKHVINLKDLYNTSAEIMTALKTIGKQAANATTGMQLVVVSVLARLYENEDITLVRNLFKYFPAGMKEVAMKRYVLKFFPVEYAKGDWHFNKDALNRFHKDDALQQRQLELASNVPWWTANADVNPVIAGNQASEHAALNQEPAYTPFNEVEVLEKFLRQAQAIGRQFENHWQSGVNPDKGDVIHADTIRKVESIVKQIDALCAQLKATVNPTVEKAAA